MHIRPVKRYGVWAAKAISFHAERIPDDPIDPHIYLQFKNSPNSTDIFEAAINVKSRGDDSRLVYWFVKDPKRAVTQGLEDLEPGFHPIAAGSDRGLDYVRSGLINIEEGEVLDHDVVGDNNDIIDKVTPVLQRATHSPNATVYIFGSQYEELDGIHKIHMNQGSLPQHANGFKQDGAMFFHFPHDDHWEAIFLAFASQIIPTDERGVPVDDALELLKWLRQ